MAEFKINNAEFDSNGNIVIQDITDSEITIHMNDPVEVNNFLTGMSDKLDQLPSEILQALSMVELPEEQFKGLNIYLTTLVSMSDVGGVVGLSLGLAITNMNKSIRYVNTPYFTVTPKMDLGQGLKHDTFQLISTENAKFPVRLEFGQVHQIEYKLIPAQIGLFRSNLTPESTIQAFVSTTVGELFSSKKLELPKLVEQYDQMIKF